ncbi:tripartite tricarboxylate transporter substrate binding protein BugD [Polynucleobacter paneuropaeus]|jgi:tripartite-type tricarboxylate transporter receptor subunit TctC|uniref:tripartite tricarboxylate transporter substrate-binding protein n=1 Tax=Polynucleobacter paneuropaeus TaxID=2527775 RepID=UPI000DBF20D6|nr:tripartite tricarboxylate transporter substrate-binding protein [Polynucleobacter paneuropaeus]AWW46417.1 tripartite tricarboxylate transporter substrate binding protein BugD [Polynucleobacter paneuropaeus]MBT8514554.1 tripartite tricarboxylate transporter substrate binding protein BugD [Polynucleobacter paneuropaeus]MBT8516401.1 tripartite tricarboxylate transporter substrate binding protein BugD [Polynucleobacter paneuropaeus]MBT8522762.1 tripartite tricarboxylate transporter substrate bin
MKPHQKLHTSLLTGLIAIAASSYLSIAPAMAADAYPNKPITLVVPFSAGGPTDAVARLIAVPMGKDLGQTVIVENTVGAGGTIATTRVARAAPDGYILYLHHMGMATAPALYKKLPFDPMKDFEYIGQVVDVPMVLLGRKNFPANNFKELEAYIKVNKEKVTIANAGPGSVSQLCGLLLMSREGVELTTVPYKGTGPALTDLLGGQVDLLCDQTTQTVPYIKDNLVKAYGVTTLKRLPGLSNIPTLDEQGLKGFEVKAWHGLYAPKGTPPEVLAKINKALRVALNNPEVKARLGESNIEVVPMSKVTSESLKNQLDSEINKWGPVIRKAGAYAD